MKRTFLAHRARRITAALSVAALVATACAGPGGGNGQATDEDAEIPSDITLVIPFSEGGGTDVWARFLAPYLENHVEGNPTVHPENTPGGESITGTNAYVSDGVTDGSELLVTSGTTYLQALLGRPEVEYDFTKMRLLTVNGTSGVIYASTSSGITVDNLANPPTPLKYGGISATGADLSLLQAFDLLGVNVDATFGFEGRGPARLALERGETNIDYQTTSAYQTQVQPLVDAGKAVPLMSFGYVDDAGKPVRDPNAPDIPTVEEVYQRIKGQAPSGVPYDAYRSILLAGFIYQKGIWANEGTPDSIAQAFYDATAAIAQDEDFKAKSGDVLGGYPLLTGKEGEKTLAEAFAINDEQRQYVLDLLKNKYGVSF
jgi:tripartite-type tricarboxylate transporter receptor subunit TctC